MTVPLSPSSNSSLQNNESEIVEKIFHSSYSSEKCCNLKFSNQSIVFALFEVLRIAERANELPVLAIRADNCDIRADNCDIHIDEQPLWISSQESMKSSSTDTTHPWILPIVSISMCYTIEQSLDVLGRGRAVVVTWLSGNKSVDRHGLVVKYCI